MLPQPIYVRSRPDFDRAIKLGETTESIVLDFKKTLDPREREWQEEVCRDIAQFANTWGGCLLFGVTERFDAAKNVKVAEAAVGVQDADKVREWIEMAIQNHLVPSTLARDVVPVVLDAATVVALNVEPSRHVVYVWNRQRHTIECLRRTSHGKMYLNPDEMERHMAVSPRARMLGLKATLARAGNQPNVRVAGGYYQPAQHLDFGSMVEPWRPDGLVRIPSIDEDTFALSIPAPHGIQILPVPYELLRASWLDRVGQDPVEGGALFVFAGKSATRLKVLWFDRNGLCLLYKRLHRAVFELPAAASGAVSIHIDGAALARLLAGVAKEEKRRVAA